MGAGTSPAERELFCVVNQATFPATSQRPIFTKFGHETYFSVPLRNPERRFGNFHVRGHLPPQNLKSKIGQNRNFTRSKLQVTGCNAEKYCLLHVCSPRPGSFRDRSTFLYDVLYGCGATGHQSCQIFGFCPIFPIQNP